MHKPLAHVELFVQKALPQAPQPMPQSVAVSRPFCTPS
jgi:hypothetical protein